MKIYKQKLEGKSSFQSTLLFQLNISLDKFKYSLDFTKRFTLSLETLVATMLKKTLTQTLLSLNLSSFIKYPWIQL